jgi:hypothetical protein
MDGKQKQRFTGTSPTIGGPGGRGRTRWRSISSFAVGQSLTARVCPDTARTSASSEIGSRRSVVSPAKPRRRGSTPKGTSSRQGSSTDTPIMMPRCSGIPSAAMIAGTALPPRSWATAASRWRPAPRRRSASSSPTSKWRRRFRRRRWKQAFHGRGRHSRSSSIPSSSCPRGSITRPTSATRRCART